MVNEAELSGAAVIATEFSGIHERLQYDVNDGIVEKNEESIHEGWLSVLYLDDRTLTPVEEQITYHDYATYKVVE